MYKKIAQTTTRLISPEEAKKLMAYNNFPGQRPLSALKARGYADQMNDGSFREFHVALMTMPSGQKYLANGQHCLQAVIVNDKAYEATVAHYKCETDADAYKLFASFDVHPTRTERTIMRAARGLFSNTNLRELPLRFLSNCGSALFALESKSSPKFTGKPSNKAEKADLVQRHVGEVMWASLYGVYEHLEKVAILAAMVATHRANKQASDDFWQLVAEGGVPGLTHRFRDRLLRNEIGRNNCGGGHNRSKLIYSECIAYWNSWMKGEDRRKTKAMKDIPKVETRRRAVA
jgi:hypothetical protein